MNQHYVPRVYLKNFATQKGKGFFVDVYDQKQDRYFNTNINRICSEIDFYTLDETSPHGPDKLVVEMIYAQAFEPLYAKTYRLLSDNAVFHITRQQRVEMIIGLFQLYMRNPKWIIQSMRFHRHFYFDFPSPIFGRWNTRNWYCQHLPKWLRNLPSPLYTNLFPVN